jgi:hypothetical protein
MIMMIPFTKDPVSSTSGFISWRRLVTELFPHEIQENERITHIEIDGHGIKYFVEKVGE